MSKAPLCKTYLEWNRKITKLEREKRKLNSKDIEENARLEMIKSLSTQIDDINNSPEYQESKEAHDRLSHLYVEIKDIEKREKEMKKEKEELERTYMWCNISSYDDLLRFINDNCVSVEPDADWWKEVTISLPAYKEFGWKTICLYFPHIEWHSDYPWESPNKITLKWIKEKDNLVNDYLENYGLSLNDIITEYSLRNFMESITKYLDQYWFIKKTWLWRPDYSPYGLWSPVDAWEFLSHIKWIEEICELKDFWIRGSNWLYKSLDISSHGVYEDRDDNLLRKDYDSWKISKYLILER